MKTRVYFDLRQPLDGSTAWLKTVYVIPPNDEAEVLADAKRIAGWNAPCEVYRGEVRVDADIDPDEFEPISYDLVYSTPKPPGPWWQRFLTWLLGWSW